ncbi:rhodanese-like domain-containing protein [Rubellimicrobium arenae]|uniref:rhodanese-like domain-containing protein n=1 Tax=Rubellimicrobium arenae TaxID=2817372 RepID=UPI001B300BC7|nr:rhodanese-like domain-containing protein [Rubellimicrobium arenae]
MTHSVATLLADAAAAVPRIDATEARRLQAEGALLLDVRDAPERAASGSVPGSIHVSRGMLEFRADPESAYFDGRFDKGRAVVLYCASGGRSALAGKTLKDMGYAQVFNLGGFKDWAAAGEPVEHDQ